MFLFEVQICFDTGCNLCFYMDSRREVNQIKAFCADCDDVIEVKVIERSIAISSVREIINYLCDFEPDN